MAVKYDVELLSDTRKEKTKLKTDSEIAVADVNNRAAQERQNSENATRSSINEALIKADAGLKSSQSGNYDANAAHLNSVTDKQKLDNAFQTSTQPGMINAADAASAKSVITSGAESTAAMSAQSDILRSAVGKGHQATPNGEIFNAPGDFLPGAGARIRGEKVAMPLTETPVANFDGDKTKWESLKTIKHAYNTPKKPPLSTRDLYNGMHNFNER